MVLLLSFLGTTAFAQQQVSVRQLNTYENLTNTSELSSQPLANTDVIMTVVLTSYPKSSGLRTYNENDGGISAAHVFAIDTAAVTTGFDGQAMQLVVNDETLIEDRTIGDVVTVRGELTFFNETAQFEVTEVTLVGNVRDDLTQYASLINPIDIDLNDIISYDGSVYSIKLENYTKYINQYVKITNGDIRVTSGGNRPNWSVQAGGVKINTYDQSLRFRNDRNYPAGYRTGYNMRRSEDGEFQPIQGAKANVSGFLIMNGGNGFDGEYGDQIPMSINPMEDGVLWLNDTRFVNGENGFTWPNDLEYVGFPASVSNETVNPASPTSSDAVTLSVDVASQENGVTVDSVSLTYTVNGNATRVAMTNSSGSTYSSTIPAQANFTSVAYYIETYSSNGIAGRFPGVGSNSYFVSDGPVTMIETIQKTGDQEDGASPLAGLGELPLDVTAVIVTEAADGIIVAHQSNQPWSGIFLELNGATENLKRGDQIKITKATIDEASVASNSNTYTYISIPNDGIELLGSNTPLNDIIPVLTTDEFNAQTAPGEAWEGMFVRFENVQVTDIGGFGEFTITTNGASSGVIANEDTRSSRVGETGFPAWVNETMRLNKDIAAFSGIVHYNFGAAKIAPRGASDIEASNFSKPRPNFRLLSPDDNTELTVEGDGAQTVTIVWDETSDYDGDAVRYKWVLTTPADENFENTIVELDSDNNGSSAQITLSYAAISGVLEGAGVEAGGSADLIWSVRASDALNDGFVATTRDFGFNGNYRAFNIKLNRGTVTSVNEDLPIEFALDQNYPNPFNPSTTIDFALPQSGQVTLNVFNMLGQRVATLVNQRMEAGRHTVNFDATNLSTGMYLYRLSAGESTVTRKMMLIK